MAFLAPHFDLDVFVSYSQGDPTGTGSAELKNWTRKLINDIRDDIQSTDPEFDNLAIWYDEKIDPTADLSDTLRQHVGSSGVLLIVMSPRYLKSRWCTDELGWFREQIQDRSRDQGRVFVVRALRTIENDWPDFLRDQRGNAPIGFGFHDAQTGRPFGWRDTKEDSDAYSRQLWTLQTALTTRLRELRERAASRRSQPPPPRSVSEVASSGRVYLHGRPGDPSLFGVVQHRLSELGIIPLTPIARSGDKLSDMESEAKARFNAAKHCHALALVRPANDDNFVGDLVEIGIDERERIGIARGASLPCAILDESKEELQIDISRHGIKRFDLSKADWGSEFSAWFKETRVPPPGGA